MNTITSSSYRFRLALLLALYLVNPSLNALTLTQVSPPSTEEIEKYIFVGTASDSDGDTINVQGTEIGADRSFLSDDSAVPNTSGKAGPNTKGVFYQDGDRWSNSSSVPSGAAKVYVGTNWSGNIALTHSGGGINLSDTDIFADTGIECASSGVSKCRNGLSNSRYFSLNVSSGNGSSVNSAIQSNIDFTDLNSEISQWDSFIQGLPSDITITNNINNENAKDGSGPIFTSFQDNDSNGITVIDIDVGDNDFELNNSDWILEGSSNQLYIFRILNGSNFNVSNSSILLGDGGIAGGGTDTSASEIGAIFHHASEPEDSSDTVFNFDNVIVNGIAFWNSNESAATEISMSNGQGCTNIVGAKISLSNIRLSACDFSVTGVSEPSYSYAYYPSQYQFGTLMFEDRFPSNGDYDFNDFVNRYNVTVKRNSETNKVNKINWQSSLVAVGASYNNGYGTELPFLLSFDGTTLTPALVISDSSATASICVSDGTDSIEIGSCSNNVCPIDNSCNGNTSSACSLDCSSGSCITVGECGSLPDAVTGLAIIQFFYHEKSFTSRNGFFNTNSSVAEQNWSDYEPFKWLIELQFLGDGASEIDKASYCSNKGKSDCTYASTPPYNPFITVNGDKSREVHLANHLGTALYSSNQYDDAYDHAGSNCGDEANDNGACFLNESNLPWAIDVGDNSFYAWSREHHDITSVFTGDGNYASFSFWVESGGNDCIADSCSWWLAGESERTVEGTSLGNTFLLKTKSETLSCDNVKDDFFITSTSTNYSSIGLGVSDNGLNVSMQADWSYINALEASKLGNLCELLDGPTSSYWVSHDGDPLYSATRPYYVKNNETNSSALIHSYIVKYDSGELLKGTSNITWSTLQDSLGGCLDGDGARCSFSGVACYVLLESWAGNRKTLGYWQAE
ncbi:MAG: LruC domain-containing protein [Pseudomonadales bacterium]|nr:LruC domain-containing protein [Pseudomonadales bacterium]